ncbi:MAG: selenide, water dikinase SelD [Firmicutes bacterium]|nr:selenide, water dikinase SelD [Bacillota bacterium]
MEREIVFCKGGGCTAKLGPAVLEKVLEKLPKTKDPNFLVGFDHSDDGAVYKLTDELALVQTLDFFPPMVEDPYIFGKIAAANALSDVYAMGGEVKTALNIVCFPEEMDLNILGQMLLGGQEKVAEAGGVLAGGHSLADQDVKYGLSVTGIVHPDRIITNVGAEPGDVLILTKPLGVGIVTTAELVGESSPEALFLAIESMQTLNKYAADIIKKYSPTACTDVTGFGFLGHLHEMLQNKYSALVFSDQIPLIPEALTYAEDFLISGAGQRNRNYLQERVDFKSKVSFGMEELLFDPQTSGGLLASLKAEDASQALGELQKLSLPVGIVGVILEQEEKEIIVE